MLWHPAGVRILALLVVTAVLAVACSAAPAAAPTSSASPSGPAIRVGTADDAESRLLAHVMADLLEAAGIPASVDTFADAQATRQALELRAIDAAPGYTGEAWLEVLNRADPPGDPQSSFATVEQYDRERHDIVWMRPSFEDGGLSAPPANATFAFVVQGFPSINADLQTMSRLAARLSEQPDALVCVDKEFARREDGLKAVWSAYGVGLGREVVAASPEDAVRGVRAGDCIAGLTTATDGGAWLAGQRPLIDDLRVFPAFVVTPVLTGEIRDRRPAVLSALGPMPAQLTTRMLGQWNAQVVAGTPLDTVAQQGANELLARAGRPVPPTPTQTP